MLRVTAAELRLAARHRADSDLALIVSGTLVAKSNTPQRPVGTALGRPVEERFKLDFSHCFAPRPRTPYCVSALMLRWRDRASSWQGRTMGDRRNLKLHSSPQRMLHATSPISRAVD